MGPRWLGIILSTSVRRKYFTRPIKNQHKEIMSWGSAGSMGRWLLQCWVLSRFYSLPQCPPGKILPTHPHFRLPALRVRAPFTKCACLSQPSHPETPSIRWLCAWSWDIITDGSKILVIPTLFMNSKCQLLLLGQSSQTCSESEWCLSLTPLQGGSDFHLRDITQISLMTPLESLGLWRRGLNAGAPVKKESASDEAHSAVLMLLLRHWFLPEVTLFTLFFGMSFNLFCLFLWIAWT